MVETAGDVCRKAAKKLGIIRSNGDLQAADAADLLASLRSFYFECVSQGTFGRIWNVNAYQGATLTAGPNQHISVTTDDAVTIDIPETMPVYDGWWWKANRDYGWGLPIPFGGQTNGQNVPPDKCVVMVTDQNNTARVTYIYDGTVQLWMRLETLSLTDEAPLSARSPDGLASVLACRVADEYGADLLSGLTMQAANRYKMALVTNYGGPDTYQAEWF